jgi:iron complex outermembrane receptor protein
MQHDAASLLSQIPAFNNIIKGGNYGFDPVFRGFKYDQLNIVLNGAQGATAACPNRMDPPTSQMAPNMLERIDILKGPHALRFGTGFGATVNFIPADLHFAEERDPYGRFSSEYLSNGNVIRSEGQIGLSNKSTDLSFFGAWSQGSDYQTGNKQIIQSDFRRGSFGTNLGIRLSDQQRLRLSATYNMARDADFPALPMDLRKDDTWLFNARHEIDFTARNLRSWNTTIFGSMVDHRMDNYLKSLDPRPIDAKTNAETYNLGARTEGVWGFSHGKLYTGADLRVEGADGTRIREFLMGPNAGNMVTDNVWQNGHISKTALFIEYQLNRGRFQYIVSSRLEANVADIKDPAGEFTGVNHGTGSVQINPNASLGMVRQLGRDMKLGVWMGRAKRSGSLTERFINFFPVGQDPYEMIGNPQLDPEVNNQMDITFEWSAPGTVLDIDLFVSYLQHHISSVIDTSLTPRLPMSPGVRRFVNIKEAFKTGFEIYWVQELTLGLHHQAGVAFTYAQDLERDEPLPEVAPLDFRYNLRGDYIQGKLQPEITFRYVAQQSRISGEFGESVTPSFALVGVKLASQLTEKIRLSAGITNLLNETYYEHLSRSVRGTSDPIFAPGRCFNGSIALSF